MATARSSGQVRSHRTRVLRGATLIVAGAIAVALAPLPAQASPDPATAGDAAALVAANAHELEVVTERFNTAREDLGAQQAAAEKAAGALAQAQAGLAAAQAEVSAIARSAFTGGGNTAFEALLTSKSADDFMEKVSAIDMVAGHQTAVLDQAAGAQQTAAQAAATAQQAQTQAQAKYNAVLGQQKQLQAEIARYQALFSRLSAQEQRAAIVAAGEGDTRASRANRAEPAVAAPVGRVVASSQAAQIAVNTALAQRGKPYVWAAAGPNAFDCSGLVLYAYKAAGVSLPHSSAMQARMGRAVSRGELQPGDLIAYYSPVSHIALYIGNGQVVQAPTAGDVVKVSNMDGIGRITAMRRLFG